MNKRGLIKFGIFALFLILVASMFIFIISIKNTSAIIEKNIYILGDKVKINLQDYQNYTLKINSPSTTYSKKGSGDYFIFSPEEIGKYKLILSYSETNKEFDFEVLSNYSASINNSINNAPNVHSINKSSPKIVNENTNHQPPILNSKGSKIPSQNYNKRIEFNKKILQKRESINKDRIEINKPVKWTKEFNNNGKKVLNIDIPIQAKNISVFKKNENKKESINFKTSNNLIKNTFSRLISLNDNLGDITITADNPLEPIEVEYFTDPPTISEEYISNKEKQVKISSPKGLHYRNVISFTTLPEEISKENMASVYWKEEEEYQDFDLFDMNNNGLYDTIQWDTPHLSEQTFNVVVGNIIEFNFQNSNSYSLGERLRINLRNLGSYELILTSPSNEKISRVGSNDFFIYDLDQIGSYTLELIIGNRRSTYTFNVIDSSIEDIQYFAEIGLPVKWKKIIKSNIIELNNTINFTIYNKLTGLPVNYIFSIIKNITIITINRQNLSNIEIEYYTNIPKSSETIISDKEKRVIISSPDNLHYENVFTHH